MNITIREFSAEDIERLKNDYNPCVFEERMIVETNVNGEKIELFIGKETVKLVGEEYICSNVTLHESKNFGYYLQFSMNNYYNDTERFPEKTIDVEYVGDKNGEYTEIYRCPETKKCYLRQLSSRENFAKWLACTSKKYEDTNEIRANIIFRCGNQTEKVTYDDWNCSVAYSNTFNENFRKGDKNANSTI